METSMHLADDPTVIQRLLDHIDNQTTDVAESSWREPVANYRSPARFAAERDRVLRCYPIAFCPSAALEGTGSFVARDAAGTPVLAVRAADGSVRAFRNACRHRGTQLASGTGCERSFVCRYHGWTYALDGSLRHVPHEHGFPGLDKRERGLVPLETVEAHGLVFVTHDGPSTADANVHELPTLIPAGFRFVGSSEADTPVNWKIVAEGFLEGYHIRSTHPETFYPLQFDNLNVVEFFGRNSRLAFPFKAIHKTRSVPAAERAADGKLTFVYHLFPNVMIATFPGRIIMVVLEPLATDSTRMVTYLLTNRDPADSEAQSALQRGGALVAAGGLEDREVACAIQRSLASGANEYFEFGRFEGAIGHFHRSLDAAIDACAADRS
jgi:phenylpropionate dioxygenase-like ring-hydroxylating dioxygenase large terminal subunit